MARMHRGLPPIVSIKHMVQSSVAAHSAGSITNIDIIDAVARNSATAINEVNEGSIIKAVYVEFWILSGDSAITSFMVNVSKNVGGNSTLLFGQSAALDSWDNKKNIFYTTQGIVGGNTAQAVPIIRAWIKIPKGKQRFGLGDLLQLNVAAFSNELSSCGIFIYKEYQ